MKTWEEMTPREQDASIHHQIFGNHVEYGHVPCPDNKQGCLVAHFGFTSNGVPIPLYTTDHAACRLVEDEIERRELWGTYLSALVDILDIYGYDAWYDWDRQWVSAVRDILRATPEQRCHAALRALEVL